MKDLFSQHAEQYRKFRPTYPKEIYPFIAGQVPLHEAAWDCGTGNGQVALNLCDYFDQVYATDISENQLKHADRKNNLVYSVAPAEKTSFPDSRAAMICGR